jgi:hypothetical protein
LTFPSLPGPVCSRAREYRKWKAAKKYCLIAHVTNAGYNAKTIGFDGFYDVTDPANPVLIQPVEDFNDGTWQAYTTPQAVDGTSLTSKIYEARFTVV